MLKFIRIFKGIFQEEEECFNPLVIIGKIIAFIAIVICIGLPITHLFGFWLVFISGLLIMSGKFRLSLRWLTVIIGIALMVILIKNILPHVALQEGHNIFITKVDGEVLERELPPPVFTYMKELFLKRYPKEKRCDPKTCLGVCWVVSNVPKSLFSFSSDSVLLKPKYSRIVDDINFSNLIQFRGGFVNDLEYNWYGGSDIQRESMPFFVMYEFSAASVNSSLCWRGHLLWETSPDNFTPIYQASEACRKITFVDVGRRVFGVSVDNNPQLGFWEQFKIWKNNWKHQKEGAVDENREQLSMRLILSPVLKAAAIFKMLLMIFSILIIILLTVKINWKHLAIPILFISIAVVITACYSPHLFGGYFIHEGGEDGLTHQTYGRNILRNAVAGNWIAALRGEQDVYWDTPGFRYFRAVEKLFFGDTNFGNLIVLLLLPYVFYCFLSRFIPKIWAFWSTIVFLLTCLPTESVGFSYYLYIMIVRGGWPDNLGYVTFLAALWLGLKYYPIRSGAYLWYGFIANFLLFITVLMRPNFSIACLIIVLYLAGRLVIKRRFKEAIFTTAGFAPVVLMLLHNYWFGKQFYLFTGAIDLAVDTPLPVYFKAFKELLSAHNFNGENTKQIITHIKSMIGPPYRLLILLPVFFAAFTKVKIPADLRLLAVVVLSLHAVNLFIFAVFWRYVFLTWTLTVVVIISLIWLWLNILFFVNKKEDG